MWRRNDEGREARDGLKHDLKGRVMSNRMRMVGLRWIKRLQFLRCSRLQHGLVLIGP